MITGVSPNGIPRLGGTAITISGAGFDGTAQVDLVGELGGSSVSVSAVGVTVNSPNSITAIFPLMAGALAGNVVVTTTSVMGGAWLSATNASNQASTLWSLGSLYPMPNYGPASGGSTVLLEDEAMTADTVVYFGSTPAEVVPYTNNGMVAPTLAVLAPPGAWAVDITASNVGGTSPPGRLDKFYYTPSVTGISPAVRPLAGGTTVTITGTGFDTAAKVAFQSSTAVVYAAATNVTVNNSTSITVISPLMTSSAGVYDVVVSTEGPASTMESSPTSSADHFDYEPVPTVTGVSASSGPNAGGTSVTITGTGFTNGATVSFGSTPATGVTLASATSLTAVSPAGGGVVDVTVTTPGGTSATNAGDKFSYTPSVTGGSPASGPLAGGTTVTISGVGFAGGATVKFGAAAGTGVTVNSASSITATSPAGSSGAVDVIVTTTAASSAAVAADKFTYWPAPVVTAVNTNAGPLAGGTTVKIAGTGFVSGATVGFGSTSGTNVTVNSASSITATSPAGSVGVVDVTVRTPGGTSATNAGDQFAYEPAPIVTAISPSTVTQAVGTTVTITGTGFTNDVSVTFGSTSATGVAFVSPTSLTAVAPPGASVVFVSVSTAGGASAPGLGNLFTYTPSVTGISPASGPASGGTSVTVSGTGFVSGATVGFGSAEGTGVSVVNASTITVTSPAGGGIADVTVATPGGTSATSSADQFTYSIMGSGDIIVANRALYLGAGEIMNFSAATRSQNLLNTTLKDPYTVAFDAGGNLLVADYQTYHNDTRNDGGVFKIDRSTGAQSIVSQDSKFVTPFGLAVEANNQILVVDLDANVSGAVFRVNPTNGAATQLSTGGSFYWLGGIAIGTNSGTEVIYVTDQGDGGSLPPGLYSVDPVSGTQTRVASGGSLASPDGLAVTASGMVVIADSITRALVQVNPATGDQTLLTPVNTFIYPTHVAMDPANGDYIVSDGGSDPSVDLGVGSLWRVNRATQAVTQITGGGYFEQPRGVIVHP